MIIASPAQLHSLKTCRLPNPPANCTRIPSNPSPNKRWLRLFCAALSEGFLSWWLRSVNGGSADDMQRFYLHCTSTDSDGILMEFDIVMTTQIYLGRQRSIELQFSSIKAVCFLVKIDICIAVSIQSPIFQLNSLWI